MGAICCFEIIIQQMIASIPHNFVEKREYRAITGAPLLVRPIRKFDNYQQKLTISFHLRNVYSIFVFMWPGI